MGKVVKNGRSKLQEEMAHLSWKASASPVVESERTGIEDSVLKRPCVVQIIEAAELEKKKLRVAGYCRVSTNLDSQESSIEGQRKHYRDYILSDPEWELVDIYWETGVSGTQSETRPELQRLLADCAAHRIDLVITKSISRFSRNTTDCLEMVRKMMALGVHIWFERENIHTGRMESELLLSILAAFAADESKSISSNLKWGIRKRFINGTYRSSKTPYGYRRVGKEYVVDPAESEVIRGIFRAVLEGSGCNRIANELNQKGVPTWSVVNGVGNTKWSTGTIRGIIRNAFYTGDSLYQKTFMDEHFKQQKNRGELDQYLDENAHPAIVDRETYRKANEIINLHAQEQGMEDVGNRRQNRYCWSGKVFCGTCGRGMLRSTQGDRPLYHCESECQNNAYLDGMENVFCNMLNKLAFAESNGIPILMAFSRKDREQEKKIMAELAIVERKREALQNRVIADGFTAELGRGKAELDIEEKEQRMKLKQVETGTAAQEVMAFRAVLAQRGIRPAFMEEDSEVFRQFVKRAVLMPETMEVHFNFGLMIKEPIRATVENQDQNKMPGASGEDVI